VPPDEFSVAKVPADPAANRPAEQPRQPGGQSRQSVMFFVLPAFRFATVHVRGTEEKTGVVLFEMKSNRAEELRAGQSGTLAAQECNSRSLQR
jgi:hypothetical protein